MSADEVAYDESIAQGGFRLTRQRREVYDALMEVRDHPTAAEVFIRVKHRMPSISLATVYNCLETLVQCGLVVQVNLERAPTRYCPNLREHGHFFCERCGSVVDVELSPNDSARWNIPDGFIVTHQEISLKGICKTCAETNGTN